MSDMEKERQAYYRLKELYAGKPTWSALAEMADSGDLLDIVSQFIDEHEKEIAALKAEKENVRDNAWYWYNERNKEIKKYQAEIERKDELLWNIIESQKRETELYGAIEYAEQVLSEEE